MDHETWDPANDPYIPAHYSAADLSGKAACKRLLQKRFLLEEAPDVPLVGVISRFVPQKGLDLLAESIESILADMRLQFVILGAGDKGLESYFGDLPKRYPGRVGSYIGYHEQYSHWIEAGSDFFLMPSRFEPCGLNQIYSLRYGTLPVVRATGGLEDTVQQYDEASGTGTGFKFWEASASAVYYTVGWAVSTYFDRPQHIQGMVQAAMAQDYSWDRSVCAYEAVYLKARKKAVGGGEVEKREVIRMVLDGLQPPYVPWSFGFTFEAKQKLQSAYGSLDLETVLHNHLLKLGSDIGFFEDMSNQRVRDVFGVVWDRSLDKDIGNVEGQVLPRPTLKGYQFPDPLDERFFADIPERIQNYGDRFRVFQIGFSLYERAWTLRGMSTLLMDFYDHPDFVEDLFYCHSRVQHISNQKSAHL